MMGNYLGESCKIFEELLLVVILNVYFSDSSVTSMRQVDTFTFSYYVMQNYEFSLYSQWNRGNISSRFHKSQSNDSKSGTRRSM
jgi:hypothetical protein